MYDTIYRLDRYGTHSFLVVCVCRKRNITSIQWNSMTMAHLTINCISKQYPTELRFYIDLRCQTDEKIAVRYAREKEHIHSYFPIEKVYTNVFRIALSTCLNICMYAMSPKIYYFCLHILCLEAIYTQ